MQDSSAVQTALAGVGPRLERARAQRDVTLTELAAATGISKSTLSRLESGQRRPSLELLLPIAQAHQIPSYGPAKATNGSTCWPDECD